MIYSSCIFETKCPKDGTALFIVPPRFFPQWQAATLTICSDWTGRTIRNRRDSDGDAANLFGTFCPKEPGLGRLPNKQIFAFWPEGWNVKNSNCGYSCPACHLAEPSINAAKKEAPTRKPPFLWLFSSLRLWLS